MGFEDENFQISPRAIDINDTRSLRAVHLVRDALRNMGKIVAASRVTILGASYREDVGDTRCSGSELIVRKIAEMGGDIRVHDPYVDHWWEFESQDTYPAVGASLSRFIRNQGLLKGLRIEKDIAAALKGADAVAAVIGSPVAADPRLEPPGVRSRFQGLRMGPSVQLRLGLRP